MSELEELKAHIDFDALKEMLLVGESMPLNDRRAIVIRLNELEQRLQKAEARADKAEGALKSICAVRYGLQAIIEDYGHDANAYNYHAMKYFSSELNLVRGIASRVCGGGDG